jgi:hypothetical protein
VRGTKTTPLVLPLRSGLPALPTITPGTQAINVGQNGTLTLQPGNYGAFYANQKATVVFTGGLYQFAAWNVDQNAKILFQAPTEVRIAGGLYVNQNATVSPDPAVSSMNANQIVFEVAGADGASGPGNTAKAASFDQNSKFSAYLVAPNGTVLFNQNATVTGAVISKWVLVLQNAKVTRLGDPLVQAAVDSSEGGTAIIIAPVITTTGETTPVVDIAANALFLPLINVNAVAASETVGSETVALETAPVLTPTLLLTTTAPVTTTVITTTAPVTSTAAGQASTAATPATIYLPLVASEGQ